MEANEKPHQVYTLSVKTPKNFTNKVKLATSSVWKIAKCTRKSAWSGTNKSSKGRIIIGIRIKNVSMYILFTKTKEN